MNKKFIEDNIPQNVLTLSFDKIPITINSTSNYKRNKHIKKILPSISEEDDKIKSNIINFVNIFKKIVNNKIFHMKKDSMTKIIEEIKINKNTNNIQNKAKHNANFIYAKKIIQKKINKNIRQNINKFVNVNYDSTKANKEYKHKYVEKNNRLKK